MLTSKSKSGQEGMSVIEIMVAVFLIFVMFVVYLSALNTIKLIKQSNYSDRAYHIANKQMEDIRAIPFASITNGTTPISDPELTSLPLGTGSYTITDNGAMTGVKDVVVTVSWTDSNTKSVVLQTRIGNGGINP
ncbi:MAG: hypothetical protein KW788_02200 [Candidatus Doudnabacteria bacterium]|nr:hypothetical protein [Candidatus Doudnabacteria bacterium]